MSKKTDAPVATLPTDRELVQQRVAQANDTIQQFVATLFDGVRGKIDDLKIELGSALLAERVSDAMLRLGEINAEVRALADEAVAAEDDVIFRLMLTRIAILKVSFTARYKAALLVVPGGPDEGTITKEVAKLFDGIAKDIAAKRKAGDPRPLPAAPAQEEVGVLTAFAAEPGAGLPAGMEVAVEGLAYAGPPASPEPPADSSWAADPEAGEGEDPADQPGVTVIEQDVTVTETVLTEVIAGATAPASPEPEPSLPDGEPVPMVVPQVGFPGSGNKSRNGQRSRARA